MKGRQSRDQTRASRESGVVTRRQFLVAGSGLVVGSALPFACDDKEPDKVSRSADPAAAGTPWAGTTKVTDLMEALHLADVDHFGEFVDFGTAARFKYTLGGWMAGWANDTSMNGVSFTWATKSPSRLYFTLAQPVALALVFRVKKGSTEFFSVYLNDHPVTRVSFKTSDWEEHRVVVEQESTLAGENAFKLVYKTGEERVGGAPASFSVDYLRIIPAGQDTGEGVQFDPPYLDRLRQQIVVGEEERDAIVLSAPAVLSYYLEVPARGLLCFAAAAIGGNNTGKAITAELAVRVTPVDQTEPRQVLGDKVTSDSWSMKKIDLAAFAGKLCRIELIARGPAGIRLAWGIPSVRAARPRVEVSEKKMRNAVVVLIDTLRADRLSVMSKTRVRTPVFAKFSRESAIFERCQAPANWTKPSCATVLTGLSPDSHKARGHSSKLVSSVPLASEIFRDAGFQTGAFIANGYLAAEFGFNRAWTKYVNFIRENKKTEAENVYKESLDFIDKHKDGRFFAYIQTIDPHVPYDPPKEDLKLYETQQYNGPVRPRSTGNLLEEFKRKRIELNPQDRKHLEALYDGEITYHDRHFGHFLDGLNKLGVLDDTVVVVCSDHGEEFFDHGSVGHGHTLHQELLHVPLAIRAPGLVPAGKRLAADVGLADVLPTVIEATGVRLAKGFEGRDLLPLCRGELADPLAAAFSSFWSEADDRNLSWTVRKGDFKLRMKGPAVTFLYNLADDPRELVDVDLKYPLALRALRILHGQYVAAPDKLNWTSGLLASQVVGTPQAKDEKTEVPEDLRSQLRALGYMQ